MNDHSRRLEYHRNVRVLIDDIDIDILRLNAGRRRFGNMYFDLLTRTRLEARLRLNRAVDGHIALANQRFRARTRDFRRA